MSIEITLGLALDLPGVRVVGGVLHEGVSERTYAKLELASEQPLDLDERLADPVSMTLNGPMTRRWQLMFGSITLLDKVAGTFRYAVELHDALWLLGFSSDTRKYRNMSARQIVTQLLDDHGVAHRWQLVTETPTRKYTSQYEERNLDFVERLLQSEGIYYSFDQQGRLLLSDRSSTAPALSQTEPFELTQADGALTSNEPAVIMLAVGARVKSGGVTLADFSWKTPKVRLRETALDEVDADLEVYDYPAGFRRPEQGQRLALLRKEALRAEARWLDGDTTIAAIQPAVAFAIGAAAGAMFAGAYFGVRVKHQFRRAEYNQVALAELAQVENYRNHFEAIPLTTPYRPPLKFTTPRVAGTHTAMVRGPVGEDIHTDQHGRFRAQFHWDRNAIETDDDSRWLRKVQELGSGMNLARRGWEMFVSYVDGDPDRPYGLARAINGTAVPSYSLPGNKNLMTVKTPSSPATGGFNEVRLDDTAGLQEISIRAEKDFDAVVNNDKEEFVGNNETRAIGTTLGRQVTGDQQLTVGGDQSASFGNNSKLNVMGDRLFDIGGSESVGIGAAKSSIIAGNDTELVGGLRLTLAGSFSVPNLASLAQSAARTFVTTASPGLGSLANRAAQAQSLINRIPTSGDEAADLALDYAKNKGKGAAKDAGKAAWKNIRKTKSATGVAGVIGDSLKSSGADAIADLRDLVPTGKDVRGQIDGIRGDLSNLVPSGDSLKAGLDGALSKLTGGISDSLKAGDYTLALSQAIDLFASGGISRQIKFVTVKLVGGAYIQATLGEVITSVGQGYLETVGGLKLTAALKGIENEVTGALTTTVGGAHMRQAGAGVTISAPISAITAGMARLTSDARIDVSAPTITITAPNIAIVGGGAQLTMTGGNLSFVGNMKLKAGGNIVLDAGTVELT